MEAARISYEYLIDLHLGSAANENISIRTSVEEVSLFGVMQMQNYTLPFLKVKAKSSIRWYRLQQPGQVHSTKRRGGVSHYPYSSSLTLPLFALVSVYPIRHLCFAEIWAAVWAVFTSFA